MCPTSSLPCLFSLLLLHSDLTSCLGSAEPLVGSYCLSPSYLFSILPSQYKPDCVTPPLASLLPEGCYLGFLAWLLRLLMIDPWLSFPGIISCHYRPWPLFSGISSLHHGFFFFFFIKNVIVVFLFYLLIFKICTITPVTEASLSTTSSGLTWHLWPCPDIDLTWVIVNLLLSPLQKTRSSRANTGCIFWYTSVPPALALGSRLETEWEIRKYLVNEWIN